MVRKTSHGPKRSSEKGPRSKALSRTFRVENELGLHARAAALFVRIASRFRSEILIQKGSQEVNGKSIMGILMLAAARGSEIRVTAAGSDAPEALATLGALIERNFEEKE